MLGYRGLQHLVPTAIRRLNLWPFVSKTEMYSRYRRRKYPDTIVQMDVVFTECCTLRCRNCANLMQYYHNPENLDANVTMSALKTLFNALRVSQLNILGGEPFVCQSELIRILEYLKTEADNKVDEIVVITNGTIIPSDECLQDLKDTPKLKVLFSNYGELSSKMNEFTDICARKGISYCIVDTEYWWDFGDLRCREEKAQKVQKRYDACYSRRRCTTLYRGKLYVCPRQAHAIRLGILSEDVTETDDFSNPGFEDPKTLRDSIYMLTNWKEYITTCRYCGCDDRIRVHRAIQAERLVDVC